MPSVKHVHHSNPSIHYHYHLSIRVAGKLDPILADLRWDAWYTLGISSIYRRAIQSAGEPMQVYGEYANLEPRTFMLWDDSALHQHAVHHSNFIYYDLIYIFVHVHIVMKLQSWCHEAAAYN